MDDVVKGFYNLAQKIPYAEEKALAYYLVREILEDLHSEGKITEKEMLAINKTAVNRAHEYIMATKNEAAHKAFVMNAVYCKDWDDPEPPEDYDSWVEMGKSIGN